MKRIVKAIAAAAFAVCLLLQISIIKLDREMPDSFHINPDQTLTVNNALPIIAVTRSEQSSVPVSVSGNTYHVDLKIFGVVPVKSARVKVVEPICVVPCGTTFGIKMFTKGVLVVGFQELAAGEGKTKPAEDAGLKLGDIILSIDGEPVSTNEDVAGIMASSGGKNLELEIARKNLNFTLDFTPVKSASGDRYMGGIWVRDSSAGIGTMTYYDAASNTFAGLGHPICDIDTGELLPMSSGEIISADITGIVKGRDGLPGELRGTFSEDHPLGVLTQNCEAGVFGILHHPPVERSEVLLAFSQDIREGEAHILVALDDQSPRFYSCTVEKTNYNAQTPTRNMVIKVTDPELIAQTGGIVQGMSGSPILQNGKLIGAVTHVFVNDATRGYGIFAENMLKYSQNANIELAKGA